MCSMAAAVDQFLGKLRRTRPSTSSVSASAFQPGRVSCRWYQRAFTLTRSWSIVWLPSASVQGGMSVVYKAKQDFTDRIVAIKMLRAQLCCDPTTSNAFSAKLMQLRASVTRTCLNVYGVGQTKQRVSRTSSWTTSRGVLAWQKLSRRKVLSNGSCCASLFIQVCDAMHHAHAHRIIHRDSEAWITSCWSKSVTGADYVKVVDFGIVKITDESQALSGRNLMSCRSLGSVYMSPEQ